MYQVNGVEMSGKSQEEVVNYLRSIKFGSVVNIIVSRIDSDRTGHHALPSSTVVICSLCVNVFTALSQTLRLFYTLSAF